MNFKGLLFIILSLCTIVSKGNPIDVERARRYAAQSGLLSEQLEGEKSKKKRRNAQSSNLQLAYTLNSTDSTSTMPLLYVFTPTSQKGYVIVAADDAVEPIVGYSSNNHFNSTTMPPQLQSMLQQIGHSIAEAAKKTHEREKEATTSLLPKPPIQPLLNDIRWGQEKPYNSMTPIINQAHAPTGCVATALAQIMYYHRYPARGMGESYYGYTNFFQSGKTVQLGAHGDYEWEKMSPNYDVYANHSEETSQAVGLLLYEVGAACNMKYGSQESYSSGANALKALQKHFNYPTARLIRRMNKSATEWEELIYNELAAERPVYLDGVAAQFGHAFVCDGYDGKGYYHINWGWDGQANGYFKFSLLSPETRGVGGIGKGAFVVDLQAIVGIAPPEKISEPQPNYLLLAKALAKSPEYTQYNPVIQIQGVRLEGYEAFDANFSLGIRNAQGDLQVVGTPSLWNIQKAYTYAKIEVRLLPESIPDGTYTLLPIFSRRGENVWQEIPIGRFFNHQITVEKEKGKLTVEEKRSEVLLSTTLDKTYLLANQKNKLKFQIKNIGESAYSSFVSVYFSPKPIDQSVVVEKAHAIQQMISLHLEPGETQEYIAELTPSNSTTYYVGVTYDPSNGLSNEETIVPRTLQAIFPLQVKDPNLYEGQFTTELEVPEKVYQNTPLHAVVTAVSHAKGNYLGSFSHLQLFVVDTNHSIVHKFKEFEVLLEKEETKKFAAGGELYLPAGDYELILTKNERNGHSIIYTTITKVALKILLEDQNTITDIPDISAEKNELLPIMLHGVLHLKSNRNIHSIKIYDLSGREILHTTQHSEVNMLHLPQSIYTIKVETDNGVKTLKVLNTH